MTVAMNVNGTFSMQNGASVNWVALAQPPYSFDNFTIGTAGLVATRQASSNATYILAKDPKTGQFQNTWSLLAIPYCVEMATNGMVCACLGDDGSIYTCGYNLQVPTARTNVPHLANASALAINAYGLYANSNNCTYMAPNAGPSGTYGAWVLCKP
jgi:hypothetical protein